MAVGKKYKYTQKNFNCKEVHMNSNKTWINHLHFVDDYLRGHSMD